MTEFYVDSDEWNGYPFLGTTPTEERMQGLHRALDDVLANRRKRGDVIDEQVVQFEDALEADPNVDIGELTERFFRAPSD